MSEHTPGPWKIERLSIGSRGGSNTCWMIGPMGACIYDDWRPREAGISEAENKANARLIAAAPDLLAACKAALALLCGTGQDGSLGHHPDNPVPLQLRAAIARAKREEDE